MEIVVDQATPFSRELVLVLLFLVASDVLTFGKSRAESQNLARHRKMHEIRREIRG